MESRLRKLFYNGTIEEELLLFQKQQVMKDLKKILTHKK